ncbi:MAG: hypothetical protein HW398_897 [Acidobacteria bacterium]|nr:hypothetical protein [Acidobacteriota bacterium]
MRPIGQALSTAMALVALAGCSDTTGVKVGDLVGTWRAVRFETTAPNTGERTDWFAAGGLAELTMTITEEGRVVLAAREPNEAVADTSVGTITLNGNRVTITGYGDALSGTLRLDSDVLTLDIPSFEFFDDIYRLVMVFRRG